VPVLLHDPVGKVAAAVHCGWRSSVADILGAAVEKMAALGSVPSDIGAASAQPSGAAASRRDRRCRKPFITGSERMPGISANRKPGFPEVHGRSPAANRCRLLQLGFLPENIAVSEECTVCMPEKYWSHRAAKGGERGSQCAVICL
jgi:copper oxidase (laccase) domain-containing protein